MRHHGRSLTRWIGLLATAIVLAGLQGCANRQAAKRDVASEPFDPFEPVNRITYGFNDLADTYVLRPVAKGYQRLLPEVIRTGVNNFFDNLGVPVDIVNAFLQSKIRQGLSDTGRLALNTTLGLGGILDPATDIGLARHDEDFGQTMGVWGVPEGPYLVVPLFGPRTMRHGIGQLIDLTYHPQTQYDNSSIRSKVNILWAIHTRSTLLGLDDEINRAFDEYGFVRDAYLQNRRYLRFDGNLPEQDLFLDDGEFDEDF